MENQAATADVVRSTGADVGLAWDGDYDRCFFFDEQGAFIEGYYLVGPAGRECFCSASRARASFMTRASPGTPSTS